MATTLTLQIDFESGEDFAWLIKMLQHRRLSATFFEMADAGRLLADAILGEILQPGDLTEDAIELLRDHLEKQDDPMGQSEKEQKDMDALYSFLALAESELDLEEEDDDDDEDDEENDSQGSEF